MYVYLPQAEENLFVSLYDSTILLLSAKQIFSIEGEKIFVWFSSLVINGILRAINTDGKNKEMKDSLKLGTALPTLFLLFLIEISKYIIKTMKECFVFC